MVEERAGKGDNEHLAEYLEEWDRLRRRPHERVGAARQPSNTTGTISGWLWREVLRAK